MEIKWICIAAAVVMTAAVAGGMLSDYHKGQCRVAAIQKNMPAEEIAKVCR